MTPDPAERTRRCLAAALVAMEAAMQERPGPYPDPLCPIHKWQLAHEHLLAARELLKED